MPLADDAVQALADDKDPPASAPTGAGRITELLVSANLMALETGVWCVFPAPGSPAPAPVTGLPGVRITRCPGMGGRPEAVSISTFREDGWLDNTAALVRVTDGPAQVLVTIYQAAGQPGEQAPRLQVLRLAGDPAATGPNPAQAPTEKSAAVDAKEPDIMAHVQGAGDVAGRFGDWLGQRGSRAWVEGFGMSEKGLIGPGMAEYQGVLGRGWLSPWTDIGKFCGSRGMALPLLGLNVRLKGPAAKEYTLSYSATFIDGSAVGPVEEGTACEAPGLAALEAFIIELVPRPERSDAPRHSASRGAPPKSPARPSRR